MMLWRRVHRADLASTRPLSPKGSMATNIEVYAEENGDSPYAVNIKANDHALLGDEPTEMGGRDIGPSPYQFLAVALCECSVMTVRFYANKHDIHVDKVAARVTYQRNFTASGEQKTDVFHKEMIFEGDRLSDDQRQTLTAIANKCPVQRTLERGCEITSKS